MSFLLTIVTGAVILAVASAMAGHLRRREMEARPRLGVADFDRVEAEMERLRLPLCRLVPFDGPPAPRGARLGGPPWSPGGDDQWPLDDEGRPMLFLAQVDLGDADGLGDFPTSGLLQVFLRATPEGDIAGEGAEAARIRWFEDPQGDARLPVPDRFTSPRSRSPLKGRARHMGVPLRPDSDIVPAFPHLFPLWDLEPDIHNRLPAPGEAEARAAAWEGRVDALRERYGVHWTGGHPSFVQEDVRIGRPKLHGFDRVLLHLGPDEFFDWGDGGELNLLIRREDLLARRFDRTWLALDGN